LKDIKFKTYGCAAAIATSSMIQKGKGKTLEEAEKLTRNDVADDLEGCPHQTHCSISQRRIESCH